MQIVFLSIRPALLAETLAYVEALMRFITEAIIITPDPVRLQSRLKITVVHDKALLGADYALFRKADHVMKNWLLRTSLANLDLLNTEFIMADDDSRPMVNIPLQFFKKHQKYNCYYYYHLENWYKRETAFDFGQRNSLEALRDGGYSTYSFSSHMPQIINKQFLTKMVEKFGALGKQKSLDEWNMYFNFCLKVFPKNFNPPEIFRTLAWPALPTDWPYDVTPPCFSFENFYPDLYEKHMIFKGLPTHYCQTAHLSTSITKICRRLEIQNQFDQMKVLRDLSYDFSKHYSLVLKSAEFKKNEANFTIKNIPQVLFVKKKQRIVIEFEIENNSVPYEKKQKKISDYKLAIHWITDKGICSDFGSTRYALPAILDTAKKAPMTISLPTQRKAPGIHFIAFDMVKGLNRWFIGETFLYKIMIYIVNE